MTDLPWLSSIQDGQDPVGFERVILSDFYVEGGGDTQIGWSSRFDAPVWEEMVAGARTGDNAARSIRSIERRMGLEIWNERAEAWETLGVDEFVSGSVGVFHLVRRSGVTQCKDLDAIRDLIKAGMEYTFPLDPLHFYKPPAPYAVYPFV